MQINYRCVRGITATHLSIHVPVNHGDEDMSFEFPGRRGDVWDITIELKSGRVLEWPQGLPAKQLRDQTVCLKVVDQGSYLLLQPGRRIVAKCEGDYVPSDLGIGGGDYIDLTVKEDGTIKDWESPRLLDLTSDDTPGEWSVCDPCNL